jgi:hypothetical protein
VPPRNDPAVAAHQRWLDFVRPNGIVVMPTVLVDRNITLPASDAEGQRLVADAIAQHDLPSGRTVPVIDTFPEFARDVLGWSFHPDYYAWSGAAAPVGAANPSPGAPVLAAIDLPDGGGEMCPSFGVRANPGHLAGGGAPWQLVTFGFDPAQDLDDRDYRTGHFQASPVSRAERYLREKGVLAAIVTNRRVVRLLVAPPGETSAWADFQLEHMALTAGRDIVAAMRALLSEHRFHLVPANERLEALVIESRKHQSEVTTELAEQVLHGLYELVRGLDAANARSQGRLLAEVKGTRDDAPYVEDDVYRGLLTFVMRLLFLLFAEERELLHRARHGQAPADEAVRQHYSLLALHARLRDDQATNPDTMDYRYGAWAQLLALFRMVYQGAPEVSLVAREGSLFDPDTYPFLEGRRRDGAPGGGWSVPQVSDGTVFRVLGKLLVIDGNRVSYRSLDVEHVGAVYETMMGFHVGVATGPSIAIRAEARLGAPVTVDLAAMLAQAPAQREAWLKAETRRTGFPASIGPRVRAATTVEAMHAALVPVVNVAATPEVVSAGHLVLFPGEERRRSGSHYTPRELTGPIVRRTLAPQLARLAAATSTGVPRPEDILNLKVCDPAMGSAAFLVETCRHLGDALVQGWATHGGRPAIPADEDEVVHARRLVAQKCVYGVDRNPMAVELAKVSLWLATLARDHAFTFIDHAFRHGDSLVGLSRRQLQGLNWDASATPLNWLLPEIDESFDKLRDARAAVRTAGDDVGHAELARLLAGANRAADDVRFFGDLVMSAFFDAANPRARGNELVARTSGLHRDRGAEYRADLDARRTAIRPLVPFHWELEFPEVFGRVNPGFDAFVGNPPFMGGSKISTNEGKPYLDWVLSLHEGAHGNGDLVAHFFRRTFNLLRAGGTFGLIATNTIAQGDTRATGLRWICTHGGEIYHATRRLPWPGMAAVIVSVVHVSRGPVVGARTLDGTPVGAISAFLAIGSMHENPMRLRANAGKQFHGVMINGMGFTFDPASTDHTGLGSPGKPTSIRRMEELFAAHPRYREVVTPYIGGEEVNSSPTHSAHRYVINFGTRQENDCRLRYPHLLEIVRHKVKPYRDTNNGDLQKRLWWQFKRPCPDLHSAIADLDRVLVIARVSDTFGFTFLPAGVVINDKVVTFPFASSAPLASLQSRVHEIWARFFSSSLGDGLQYTPTDCFETFPFPEGWEARADLEAAGQAYYAYRANLMVANGEGLTKTYSRFHDPDDHDPQIARLRALHAEMDRAVLDAYGWTDVPVACAFIEENPEEDEDDARPAGGGRARRRKYRYRWPDGVRDEVMERLLTLNRERAADEAAGNQRPGAGGGDPPQRSPRGRPPAPRPAGQGRLV